MTEGICNPERIAACRCACCRLPFHLTDEEAAVGLIRWHPDFPYHILQTGPDHYCVHFDGRTMRCTVYENRPAACREFDCRRHGIPPDEG